MSNFFNEIGKKISKTGSQAIDRTKNFAEVSRLNLKLAEEEQQLEDLYANLGRLYFKANRNNPELMYREIFGAIEGSQKNAAYIQNLINELKGSRTCPDCKAPCLEEAAYCARCGTGLNPVTPMEKEIVYKLCTNCGEVGQAGDERCFKCHRPL